MLRYWHEFSSLWTRSKRSFRSTDLHVSVHGIVQTSLSRAFPGGGGFLPLAVPVRTLLQNKGFAPMQDDSNARKPQNRFSLQAEGSDPKGSWRGEKNRPEGLKKKPKPVKGKNLGGLGWAYARKDGASPLRHMTRGEAAVVLWKTLNPKP